MIEEIYREAESLKKMTHKNIIQLYHAFVTGKDIVMIMEYAGGGEVFQLVEKEGKLSEKDARDIFKQIVNAVNYCHKRGIVH